MKKFENRLEEIDLCKGHPPFFISLHGSDAGVWEREEKGQNLLHWQFIGFLD